MITRSLSLVFHNRASGRLISAGISCSELDDEVLFHTAFGIASYGKRKRRNLLLDGQMHPFKAALNCSYQICFLLDLSHWGALIFH